jgi:hypothetical protein
MSTETAAERSGQGQPTPTPARREGRGAPPGKAVAIGGALLVALVLQFVFALSYTGALHDPKPHRVPVAVVGTIPPDAPIRRSTALRLVQKPDERAARAAITDRDVYGAVVLPSRRLLVATAASPAVAQVLERAFSGAGLRVQDVRPLAAGDPRGLSIFYAVLAWVFGGYLGATILGLVVGTKSRGLHRALARLSALAVYAVAAGLLGALVAEPILHALSGHFLPLAGVGMLIVFAAAALTEALVALFGIAGTGIALVALILLGNPATGVAFSPAMIPGFWRAIGFWLPPGAGVRAETGAVYFQGHATLGALAVLAVYASVGAAVALLMGRRRRPHDPEVERAAAAG